MTNANDDDEGEMGATGEDQIREMDDEDDMSGSEDGYSPNQSPNPKETIKPGKKDIM